MRPQHLRVAWALRRLRESPFYVCEPQLRTRTKIRPLLALAGVPAAHCSFIEDVPMLAGEHWADYLLRFGETTPSAFSARSEPWGASMDAAPRLQASAVERAERDAWLSAAGMDGRPLVLLQPANKRTMRWNGVRRASDDDMSWPADRWAALAGAISQSLPQAQVLLCGSPAEAGYLDRVRAACEPGQRRVEVAALPLGRLNALLEVAHSMVSVDTGPAHLAAAVGCPLVVLGGLPAVRRVDEIATGQVLAAWRSVWRRRSAAEVDTASVAAPAQSVGLAG